MTPTGHCECVVCRSWKWGFRIAFGLLAVLFVVGLLARSAHAADIPITVCADMPLPGPEHVLNPHDPPAKQVREKVTVCEEIKVPGRVLTPTKPLTYQPRNPRSFA